MNGPEHYREAERLLAQAANIGPVLNVPGLVSRDVVDKIREEFRETTGAEPVLLVGGVQIDLSGVLAAAQVHATLALVAATAAQHATAYDGDEYAVRSRGWAGVA